MKKFLTLLAFTTYLNFCATPILASSTTISISPPVLEIIIEPNKKLSQTFSIEHDSGENLMGILEIHRATPSDNLGHMAIDPSPINPANLPLVINSLTHPLNKPFPLVGDSTQATLTLESASTDQTEDLYFALVFKVMNADSPTTSSSAVSGISSLLLVTITPTGSLPTNLDIVDFQLPVIHDSWLPLGITGQIQNNSNIMIRPKGELSITSPSGQSIAKVPLFQNLVLGNSTRSIFAEQDSSAQPLSWSPTWKNLGPIRVSLTLTSQGGSNLAQIEKVVWILPIRLIFILISVIFLLLTIFLTYKRKNPSSPIDS